MSRGGVLFIAQRFRLGCGDSLDQIVLFGFTFRADGHGVQHSEAQREAYGFIFAIYEITLREDLHANDSLSRGLHLADYAQHGSGIGVHVGANGVVEMRFFGGLSVEETAEVLKVSPETVMRDWRLAKAWLLRELSGKANDI
jgi:hypothetical protein